jgi:hypothetical protein
MRVIERLAAQTGYSRTTMKLNIIGGALYLPQADWNRSTERTSGNQAFINRLVWENRYTQVVGSPTQVDALLDVYLVQPENSLVSCSTVQG